MSVKYDLYKSPTPNDREDKNLLHARPVTSKTVSSKELAEHIHAISTFNAAEVTAVLNTISQAIVEELKDGNRVHLQGLGYFQLTLDCPPATSAKGIRAETIKFRTVSFRPEKELKRKFANVHFERDPFGTQSTKPDASDYDTILADYFRSHTQISRKKCQQLTGLCKSTTINRLNEWIAKGQLRKVGLAHFPTYEKVEGAFEGQ